MQVPKEWSSLKTTDYFDRVTDGTHDSPKRKSQGYPLATSKNLINGKLCLKDAYLISEEDYNEINKRSKVEYGDIIFAMIGTIGNPVVVHEKSPHYAVKNVALFKSGGNMVRASWAYQYFSSEAFKAKIDLELSGSTQKFVSLGFLRNLHMPTPPLPEQKRIAEILSTCDEQIEATEKQIAKLKDLKKAMMQELLTKGIGHTEFKDTPLGSIPKSWEVVPLNSIGKIVTGNTPPTSDKSNYGGVYPFVSPADISDKLYLKQTKTCISEKGKKTTRIVPPNSVMTVCIGSTIGKVCINNTEVSTNQQINSLICHNDSIGAFYYYQIFLLASKIKGLAGTQAVPLINKTEFGLVFVAKPPLEEQQQIANILSSVDNNIENKQSKLDKLKDQKKALMNDLLTGKVRV